MECNTARAGASVWCCWGCLQPSGRRGESWKLSELAVALDPGVGRPFEHRAPVGPLALAGETCWQGCHAFGALPGAVHLLLKLIPLCFVFHSVDLLKLILSSRSWEGVGREEGVFQWERDGMLSPPCPPAHHFGTMPLTTNSCLLPLSFSARPL